LGNELFHPTTLVNFQQCLDSTQMLGRVSQMSRLDCVRESLRLASEELAQKLPPEQQLRWWSGLGERCGESQTDYRASLETLALNFVVGLVTHSARESDEEGARKMEAEQKALGMDKPPVQYADGADIPTEKLLEAAAEGRELIGPAPGAPNNNEGRSTSEAFQVTVEQHRAISPAGHPNTQCSRLEEQATARITYRFEWDTATCAGCPLREQCIKAAHPRRTLVVSEHHTALQARRREQQTQAFRQRTKHRNGIEGTQSELVRAHGLRRARYRGLAKAWLQNYFIGAACNIKRWLRLLAWEMKQNSLTIRLSTASAAS
jgi:hypothetical protein